MIHVDTETDESVRTFPLCSTCGREYGIINQHEGVTLGRIVSECEIPLRRSHASLFPCPKCKVAYYCSAECQKKDSARHSKYCEYIIHPINTADKIKMFYEYMSDSYYIDQPETDLAIMFCRMDEILAYRSKGCVGQSIMFKINSPDAKKVMEHIRVLKHVSLGITKQLLILPLDRRQTYVRYSILSW